MWTKIGGKTEFNLDANLHLHFQHNAHAHKAHTPRTIEIERERVLERMVETGEYKSQRNEKSIDTTLGHLINCIYSLSL